MICTNTGTAIPSTNLIIDPPTASPFVFTAQFDETTDVYPLSGLAPGQCAQIDVGYAPTGTSGASGDTGTLFIENNGGQGRTIEIPLSGQGLNAPPCRFVVSPSQIDFGNARPGETWRFLSFAVENVGSDACRVQGLRIQGGAAGAFLLLSTSIQPEPGTDTITIPPPGDGGGISDLTVTVVFTPSSPGKSFSAEADFAISDPSGPNQVVRLSGSSEPSCLVVAPQVLEFGEVGVDDAGAPCTSTRGFSIFNACTTAATVKAIEIESGPGDLAPQFSMAAGSTIPRTIQPGDSAAVYGAAFEPSSDGIHTAQLLISDGTVEAYLPMLGTSIAAETAMDTFTVHPLKADVLFILDVDDNQTAQKAVAAEMAHFLAAAGQIDYRLAITTSNDAPADATAELGRLLPCHTCSVAGLTPTIVSPSSTPPGGTAPDPATVFTSLWSSIPSDMGYADGRYFAALYNALQRGQQPGVDFFRPGVFFAAITVGRGEADDTSRIAPDGGVGLDPAWYSGFFETYFPDPRLLSWNYVGQSATVAGTGLLEPVELPPGIAQMLSAAGGDALNTEDPGWPSAFASIWTSATTAGARYPLSGQPGGGQGAIAVSVNGTIVAQLAAPGEPNWTYQPASNTLVLNTSVYSPTTGDAITVTYPLACQSSESLVRAPRLPRYAFSSAAMSNFTIFIIASVTRLDRAVSLSLIISSRAAGTICHRSPNLSLSQPHACGFPPFLSNASQ